MTPDEVEAVAGKEKRTWTSRGHSENPDWLRTRGRKGTVEERFWSNVRRNGEDECWPWLGQLYLGYGRMHTPFSSCTLAHHVAVLLSGRGIPAGMVIDHTCRNRACQNPLHLRVVTQRLNSIENSISPAASNSQKTHCIRGHEFTPENTINHATGRGCKTCQRMLEAAYRVRRRGQKSFKKPEFAEFVAHLERQR